LLEGEINAAMVGDVQDIPARIDDWLLFEERYVAVLAPTHQLANRPSIGIDDLRETVLLERAGCDVAPKIQRSYFPEEPPHLGHCSGHDLHLQHMAAAGFGVILAPEHMPRLPTLLARGHCRVVRRAPSWRRLAERPRRLSESYRGRYTWGLGRDHS
jgi:DNA-binding transcriptional LysR family regulator